MTHKLERSRSDIDVVFEIHEGDDTEDHSECTVIDTDIWYLRVPQLPTERRDFTLEEAYAFNEMLAERVPEAEVVNASFRKMGVLPVGMIAAFVLAGGIILGARFA